MKKEFTKSFVFAALITLTTSVFAQTFNYPNTNKLQVLVNSEMPAVSPTFTDHTARPYYTERITGFFGSGNSGQPLPVTLVSGTSYSGNTIRRPYGLAFDGANYYIGEAQGNKIKRTDFSTNTGINLFAADNSNFPNDSFEGFAIHPKNGKLYVANGVKNNLVEVRNITGTAQWTVIASGVEPLDPFKTPKGIAISNDGLTMYLADTGNHRILKATFTKTSENGTDVYTLGAFTVLAGSATSGRVDGNGTTARFNNPSGIVLDGSGNLLVADAISNAIRKVTPTGDVTTLAKKADNTVEFKNALDSEVATINKPFGITITQNGVIYVGDYITDGVRGKIYKITNILEHVVGQDIVNSPTQHYDAIHNGYGTSVDLRGPRQLVIGRNNKLAFVQRDYHCLTETKINHFSISPTLPTGLNFDEATGKIWGKPTSTLTEQEYVISYAEEANGVVTLSQNIKLEVVTSLPVSLTSFEAKKQTNGSVNITWTTASEKDNSHFTLAKSTDGTNFATLATKKALGNQGGTYNHVDTKVAAGANYYKLQQVDVDGTTTDLGIKVIQGGVTTAAWSVYPNPSNGTDLNIQYTGNNTSKLVKVYNLVGQQVFAKKVILNGTTKIAFASKLAAGIYTIQIEGLGTQKFIVK